MRQVALAHAITKKPRAEDFRLIDVPQPECADNGILVRTVYLSLDPYIGSRLRGRHMGDAPLEPMKDVIPGAIVGQVVKTQAPGVSEGDWVHSMEGGWQEYAALGPGQFRKLDPEIAPLSAHAGVLGMPGLTAWAGITQLAKVGPGDTVLIDAAAGPVGGTAGQIARIKGAQKIVGIAGGAQKCALVEETYGFDACVDYKADGWQAELKRQLPDGLSVFFENVSADMAMIALGLARPYARGVLCGLVDAYHDDAQSQHALNAGLIIGKRAQLSGLVVYDYYDRWNAFAEEAGEWIRGGKLNFAEDRVEGLENAPALFERLMQGHNLGKALVCVAREGV